MKILILGIIFFIISNISIGQGYWQQRVEYTMMIDFDIKKHRYEGDQKLTYFNNSPDTLFEVYYHLYLNAFQPGSMMDVRSQSLPDPDGRVRSRIGELSPNEIGFIKVNSLSQDGSAISYEMDKTILVVKLGQPIAPNSSTVFQMNFSAQVPKQIRRTGRNSLEGIDYSMSQWYPKMAEYDRSGWHTHPYIAREFYAPWGDFDVKITIDRDYVLAGTGILQNPNEIGFGYEDQGVRVPKKPKQVTWHFQAENVHDFVWSADKDYIQTTAQVPGGPLIRFFYVPNEETKLWETIDEYTVAAFQYVEENYGKYGWSEYSIIQGGDGGMEYPMATLIANKTLSGVRSFSSLLGVICHEFIHSWYQGMLATNESYFAWMDEGFTVYVEAIAKGHALEKQIKDPLDRVYKSYQSWVLTGDEESASTHSDHFSSNRAYSRASYTKGALALRQLGYIIGEEALNKGMLQYHQEWAFKHPDMNDFVKVMEKAGELELSWYFDYWIQTTKFIDYTILSAEKSKSNSIITLKRIGEMPMPIDLEITKQDGSKILYYIPLHMMLGEKAPEGTAERIIGEDWPWTNPEYSFTLDIPLDQIKSLTIDPTNRLMDINRANNIFEVK